jgi:Bacteriophage Mu Gp45 spike protein
VEYGRHMIRVRTDTFSGSANKIARFSAFGCGDEYINNREAFQHYGFASRPPSGVEGIVIQEGNHLVMIAEDDRRYRIALEDGESALYNSDGDKVHLMKGRILKETVGDSTHDGTIALQALGTNGKAKAAATLIELLSSDDAATERLAQKILNGQTFQLWADTHQHPSFFAAPTGVPVMTSEEYPLPVLSETVKASP